MEFVYLECVHCGEPLITGLNGDVCLNCLKVEQEKEERESQMAFSSLKHDLAESLQALKKFNVGYTSDTHEAIAVEHNGRVFILRFEETLYTLDGAVEDLF